MYSRILVPFDHSDAAEKALRTAIEIAAAEDSEIFIFECFYPPIPMDSSLDGNPTPADLAFNAEMMKIFDARVEDTRVENEALLQKAIYESGKEISAESLVAVGFAASEIVKAAREHECDLIVMGRRGVGVVRALASVSFKVLHGTDLPVLLLK